MLTLRERGLDFIDAVSAFDGRQAVHVPAVHQAEQRFLTITIMESKFYTVVWTWRDSRRRIISFRRSRVREESQYRAFHG